MLKSPVSQGRGRFLKILQRPSLIVSSAQFPQLVSSLEACPSAPARPKTKAPNPRSLPTLGRPLLNRAKSPPHPKPPQSKGLSNPRCLQPQVPVRAKKAPPNQGAPKNENHLKTTERKLPKGNRLKIKVRLRKSRRSVAGLPMVGDRITKPVLMEPL